MAINTVLKEWHASSLIIETTASYNRTIYKYHATWPQLVIRAWWNLSSVISSLLYIDFCVCKFSLLESETSINLQSASAYHWSQKKGLWTIEQIREYTLRNKICIAYWKNIEYNKNYYAFNLYILFLKPTTNEKIFHVLNNGD